MQHTDDVVATVAASIRKQSEILKGIEKRNSALRKLSQGSRIPIPITSKIKFKSHLLIPPRLNHIGLASRIFKSRLKNYEGIFKDSRVVLGINEMTPKPFPEVSKSLAEVARNSINLLTKVYGEDKVPNAKDFINIRRP